MSEIWEVISSLIMIKSLNPLEIDHFVQGQYSCTSCCSCHLPQLHCECRCTENAEAALRMLFLVMPRKKVSGTYVLWGMFFQGCVQGEEGR